jgi:hypothetical protein
MWQVINEQDTEHMTKQEIIEAILAEYELDSSTATPRIEAALDCMFRAGFQRGERYQYDIRKAKEEDQRRGENGIYG